MKDFRCLPSDIEGLEGRFRGPTGFENKLNLEDLQPLKQRIEIRRQNSEDLTRGVGEIHRSQTDIVEGASSEIFSPEALSLICSIPEEFHA